MLRTLMTAHARVLGGDGHHRFPVASPSVQLQGPLAEGVSLVLGLARAKLGRTSAARPVASTPCTAKTFLARSIPRVTIAMDFPFRTMSRMRRSTRCLQRPKEKATALCRTGGPRT